MSVYAPAGASDFDSDSGEDIFGFGDDCEVESCIAPERIYQNSTFKPSCDVFSKPHKQEANIPDPLLLHDIQTAVLVGDLQAVRPLLQKVPSVDVVLSSGWSALMYASYFAQIEIVKFLLQKNADVHFSNNEGINALHAACKSNVQGNGNCLDEIVLLLLNAGADVAAIDSKKRTPLMYAARGGQSHIVSIFIECEKSIVNFNMKDERGWTAGDWAAVYGHLNIIKNILKLGITMDSKSTSYKLWPKNVLEYINARNSRSAISNQKDLTGKQTDDLNEHTGKCSLENCNIKKFEAGSEQSQTKSDVSNLQEIDREIWAEKESGYFEQSQSNIQQCGLLNDAVDKMQDSEDLEIEYFPNFVVRESMESQEYETYGQLELFLLGLDLAKLIPIFKEQDITFGQLLCLTMEELETIGINALGTRKRILSAIRECHEKNTNSSDLPDYTRTALTFDNMMLLVSGASEQISYISSCLRYIQHHIDMYPNAFQPGTHIAYEEPPIKSFNDKLDEMTRNAHSLNKSLKYVKSKTAKIDENTMASDLIPTGMEVGTPKLAYVRRSRIKQFIGFTLLGLLAFTLQSSKLQFISLRKT